MRIAAADMVFSESSRAASRHFLSATMKAARASLARARFRSRSRSTVPWGPHMRQGPLRGHSSPLGAGVGRRATLPSAQQRAARGAHLQVRDPLPVGVRAQVVLERGGGALQANGDHRHDLLPVGVVEELGDEVIDGVQTRVPRIDYCPARRAGRARRHCLHRGGNFPRRVLPAHRARSPCGRRNWRLRRRPR